MPGRWRLVNLSPSASKHLGYFPRLFDISDEAHPRVATDSCSSHQ